MDPSGCHSHPTWFKLELFKCLSEYDRILFVDADILIRPNSPNIFNIVPEGKCALYNEFCLGQEKRQNAYNIYLGEYNRVLRNFSLPQLDAPFKKKYYNSGVFIVDRSCNFLIAPITELQDVPWAEQTHFNVMIEALKLPVIDLPKGFNDIRLHLNKPFTHHTYFVHYAGMGEGRRSNTMKMDIEEGYI